jgi:hypothetical protein
MLDSGPTQLSTPLNEAKWRNSGKSPGYVPAHFPLSSLVLLFTHLLHLRNDPQTPRKHHFLLIDSNRGM